MLKTFLKGYIEDDTQIQLPNTSEQFYTLPTSPLGISHTELVQTSRPLWSYLISAYTVPHLPVASRNATNHGHLLRVMEDQALLLERRLWGPLLILSS